MFILSNHGKQSWWKDHVEKWYWKRENPSFPATPAEPSLPAVLLEALDVESATLDTPIQLSPQITAALDKVKRSRPTQMNPVN